MRTERLNFHFGARALLAMAGLAVVMLVAISGPIAGAQTPRPAQTPAPPSTAAPRALQTTIPPAQTATAAPAAGPRDLTGSWQGTLQPPTASKGTRFVIKIAKGDGGGYKATLFNADQPGQPLPFNSVTLQGNDVKITATGIGGFDGKLSADGNTMDGSMSLGRPTPIPFTIVRATPDTAWAIPEPLKPMAADADPGFDVVTVKPSDPKNRGKGFGMRGRHFTTLNTNLNDLIAFAYGLHSKQIIGAPDWFGTDLFDLDGVPDVEGQPSLHQMEMMVGKMLPDRFQLKFHHEQRELSVYIITVAPGGPKMAKTTSGPNDPQGFGFRGLGDLIVRNLSMTEFATWMQSGVMDKPVVDHTGLTGKFDFALKWTPDDSQFAQFRGSINPQPPAAGDNPDAPPSLYTAVQETLGLKIEAGKAMDDVIVIDHVEKPTPN
jgi:uncharacterized protein (TIGR03435 family)